MKKALLLISGLFLLSACESELTSSFDPAQKPASVKIKGYSHPEAIQLTHNGAPVIINQNSSYSGNIETTIQFVIDKGDKDILAINDSDTGNVIAKYEITYDNAEEYKELYFFNLPDIFLQTYAVKPAVSIGKVGFVFLFPNLGEFSGSDLEGVKGVLKRQNGTVLAEFQNIGKENFTELKIYNFFSATAPVFLELYKPGTTEPYTGTELIQVQLVQTYGANMIVLQEKMENGNVVVKGDIDIADYL